MHQLFLLYTGWPAPQERFRIVSMEGVLHEVNFDPGILRTRSTTTIVATSQRITARKVEVQLFASHFGGGGCCVLECVAVTVESKKHAILVLILKFIYIY
jgi:hypothetical protein